MVFWNMVFRAFVETMSEYGNKLLWLGAEYLIAISFSLLIHEFGHLIGGLLTGYRFVSFTFFGFTLYRKRGKLHFIFRRHFLHGQCLMEPSSKECSCVLLIAGGYLLNLLTATIAAVVTAVRLLLGTDFFKTAFGALMAFTGCLLFLANKKKNGDPTADGAAYDEVRQGGGRQFNALMIVYRMIIDGITFAEIPDELYSVAESGPQREMSRELSLYRRYARLQGTGHAPCSSVEQQGAFENWYKLAESVVVNEDFTDDEKKKLVKLLGNATGQPYSIYEAFSRVAEANRSLAESRKTLSMAVMAKLFGVCDEENAASDILIEKAEREFYSGEWKSAYLTFLADFKKGEKNEESWQSV